MADEDFKYLFTDNTGQAIKEAETARNSVLSDIKAALVGMKTSLDTQNTNINAWGGALADLTTGEKSSLVGAINWVFAKEQAHEQNAAMHDVYEYLDSVSTAETGSGIHNSLFRGKNLGSAPTADQYARIIDRTYKGLWLGDLWSKSITFNYLKSPTKSDAWWSDVGDDTNTSTTISPVMRIGDHEYYRRAGDNIDFTRGHLNIIPDAPLYYDPMTQGKNDTTGAYAGSDMRSKYLAGAVAAFEAFFGSSHVLSYRDYLQNAVKDGRASGGSWYDCRVELMDERQVYGGLVFDSGSPDGAEVPNRYTVATKQFALFRVRPDLISNRTYFWLRNVVSAAWFAHVNDNGYANYYDASNLNGVRPAALIG